MGKLFLPLIQRCPPACVNLEKCPGAPLARGNAGEAALRDLGDAARKVILRQRVQVAVGRSSVCGNSLLLLMLSCV